MHYQVTIRYGGARQRYHTFGVDAPDASEALRIAAGDMPPEIAQEADIVELRVAVDPEQRSYLGEGE